ncbi:MAG: serine/threonine-protein kinase [Nannocystaceae bacterium]
MPRLSDPERIGRYVILARLGAGGMGVVVVAYDPKLDRKVAIKLLNNLRDGDRESRLRMEREAQAMARLAHPNVVTVYEVGEFEGHLFVAMEFVKGKNLNAWLREREPSDDWRTTLDMFIQAGQGLAAAHQAGIVHRDFKPDNVFVGDDGRVRVGDFGLARREDEAAETPATRVWEKIADTSALAHDLTTTGMAMGTPAYMAPEQFLGQSIDARTDQFAFN